MKLVRRIVAAAVIMAVLAVAVRLSMPWLARRLVRSDPLARADLIVVLGSWRIERTLEAGMLFREGYAPRVLLLRPPDIVRDRLRQQLNLRVPVFIDVQHDVLQQMGVPPAAIVDSPRVQDSTRTEAVAVADYARRNGCRRIIVVTSPYHTGRAGSLIEKAAQGGFTTTMRADRYESFAPDRWWRRFPDRSDVVLEYMKTAYGWWYQN